MLAFLADEPPVLCDWLPWNHTVGGNHNFGLVLYNGGTLYIDEGRPTPAGIETTVRNLREIAATAHFNVPRGYEMLMPYLRADAELRERFFSRLKLLFYAAAGLSQRFFDELSEMAVESLRRGRPVDDRVWRHRDRAVRALHRPRGRIVGRARRARARRGAQAGAGRREDRGARARAEHHAGLLARRGADRARRSTRKASTGSATRCGSSIPDDPAKGLVFDGRLAEDFKLSTGTWVSVGPLRAQDAGARGRLRRRTS